MIAKKERLPWGFAKNLVAEMKPGEPHIVAPRFQNAVCSAARKIGYTAVRRRKFVPGGHVFEIVLVERKEAVAS